jgi:hypothetical protein
VRRDEVRKLCAELIAGRDGDDFPAKSGVGIALAAVIPDVLDELEAIEREQDLLYEHFSTAALTILRTNEAALRKAFDRIAELKAERDRLKAGMEMVAQIIHGSTRTTKAIADAVLGGADPNDPRFTEIF